jgi:hypothetical protein
MMMNIRGLILDNPGHTMDPQTLEFANTFNLDLEIQEGLEARHGSP